MTVTRAQAFTKAMRRVRGVAIGAVLFMAPFASNAAATSCVAPIQAEAIAVRILQSELTVGALACGQHQQYADFIDRHADTLRKYGAVLTAYFTDRYGAKQGQRALDTYVTRLANEASTRKSGWASHYCVFVAALHDHAAAQPSASLGAFAARQPQARRLSQRDRCP